VVSTADTDGWWDLCCDLREHLIYYINGNFPEALPRRRTEFLTGDEPEPYAAVFPDSAVRRPRGERPGPTSPRAYSGPGGPELRDGDGDGSGEASGEGP